MKKVDETLPEYGKPMNAYLIMPKSIKVAVISMGFYMLIIVIIITLSALKGTLKSNSATMGMNVAIWGLILWGLVQRNKAAWWFALVMNLIGILALSTVAIKGGTGFLMQLLLVVFMSPTVVSTIALAQGSAKKYVGMLCPQCGSINIRANRYMRTGSVCKKCNYIWG